MPTPPLVTGLCSLSKWTARCTFARRSGDDVPDAKRSGTFVASVYVPMHPLYVEKQDAIFLLLYDINNEELITFYIELFYVKFSKLIYENKIVGINCCTIIGEKWGKRISNVSISSFFGYYDILLDKRL